MESIWRGWEDTSADRCVQVWDHGGNGCVRYSAATVGLPVMGYVAENRVIQAALGQTLKSRSSVVDYMSPVKSSTALFARSWSVGPFQCIVCQAACDRSHSSARVFHT